MRYQVADMKKGVSFLGNPYNFRWYVIKIDTPDPTSSTAPTMALLFEVYDGHSNDEAPVADVPVYANQIELRSYDGIAEIAEYLYKKWRDTTFEAAVQKEPIKLMLPREYNDVTLNHIEPELPYYIREQERKLEKIQATIDKIPLTDNFKTDARL